MTRIGSITEATIIILPVKVFPFVFYDGMLKADYHKPTDTVDKINWDLYQKRAQMIFHTAWEMANREQMLVRIFQYPPEQDKNNTKKRLPETTAF